MIGGEIFVKKLPSVKILDLANAINNKIKKKFIGIRPGEKLHEQMISKEEFYNTVEFKDYFKIIPSSSNNRQKYLNGGKLVKQDFEYNSMSNKDYLNVNQIKNKIKKINFWKKFL